MRCSFLTDGFRCRLGSGQHVQHAGAFLRRLRSAIRLKLPAMLEWGTQIVIYVKCSLCASFEARTRGSATTPDCLVADSCQSITQHQRSERCERGSANSIRSRDTSASGLQLHNHRLEEPLEMAKYSCTEGRSDTLLITSCSTAFVLANSPTKWESLELREVAYKRCRECCEVSTSLPWRYLSPALDIGVGFFHRHVVVRCEVAHEHHRTPANPALAVHIHGLASLPFRGQY